MSRIGRNPVIIPENVNVDIINNNKVIVKGPKGELQQEFKNIVNITKKDNKIMVDLTNKDEIDRSMSAYWGLTRKIIQNMVDGVTKGFEKKLFIEGVGYKAQLKGNNLVIILGYTKPVEMNIPPDLKIEVKENVNIIVRGVDKYKVGQFSALIREQKKPEPYKGKGIRYLNEHIRRKVGKAGV